MPQFHVHRNPNAATRERFPFLLDVQSALVADLATRVVAPLCPAAAPEGGPIDILMPVLDINENQYVMVTPQLAGIPTGQLGPALANLSACRGEIVAALDLLFTGI